MKPKTQERGQALVIIALAVVGLFGFSALAIDGSRVFSDRRNAQNAADTAALAAALAYVRADDYQAAAISRAKSNGYEDDANSTVEVHLCSEVFAQNLTPTCEGLPGGENPAEYIQVKIVSTIPATFARILGRTHFTNVLTAIARTSDSLPSPLANGAALAALKPEGDNTLYGNGNIFLDVINSGVFNNSTANCGMGVVGNGSYTVDTAFEVVSGTYCPSGHPQLNGPVQPTTQIQYPPDIAIQNPSIACSGNPPNPPAAVGDTITFTPGNYGSININSTGNVHFSPGNYCFNGGVTIGGTANVIANDVNFRITSGEFSTAGSSTFTCNDVLVYIDGGSGIRFNGNGGNFCNSVTFFARTGSVTWNGNVGNRFFAPTGGEYEGLLIYMPLENTSPLTINGNSDNELTGTILAIASPITITGNSGTSGLRTQIIGYTVNIQGNSNTVINYDPDDQFAPPDPSTIGLTK